MGGGGGGGLGAAACICAMICGSFRTVTLRVNSSWPCSILLYSETSAQTVKGGTRCGRHPQFKLLINPAFLAQPAVWCRHAVDAVVQSQVEDSRLSGQRYVYSLESKHLKGDHASC